MVFGDRMIEVDLPDRTEIVSPGVALPLEPSPDLDATVANAVDQPLDGPPLRERARSAKTVTIAFDDATVPCFAPVWATAIPIIVARLESAGVTRDRIRLVCANSLHRQLTAAELRKLLGDDVVGAHGERLTCHDAEDPDALEYLGRTPSGYDVELNRCVTESDLTIYLNCSTTRGFSGGWKSVCVGLSSYRSIHHHHTPDVMSMSLDRNRMHEILDEMGALVDEKLGTDRVFKLESVLANPLQVHDIYGGSVAATRRKVVATLAAHQPARRNLLDEPADVVVYGVPDWSPYAAYSHGNPILDIISTGLGYLGGVIQGLGKPGCTAILATPAPWRWDDARHPSYRDVWENVLPETRDPDDARARFESSYARRADYLDAYRNKFGFHPVHGIMALYPLKRLRHAGNVIVAGAEDPAIPRHCGCEAAATVEEAIGMAEEVHGRNCSIAFVDYPLALNRS
ncbi:MAG TPA: lactate racemase domain-containing protein [Actinomycetota bacterium]|nr:lactate racemase domain-containing protein [Actinomycetota bacterium]